jgi:hypothetical protein
MNTNTLSRPTSDTIDIDYHRREALLLRERHTFDLMRGATVTTWSLVVSTILLLAVTIFVPRSHVTPGAAMTAAPMTVAISHH